MMQHRAMDGIAIGLGGTERFEDSDRRIKLATLAGAALSCQSDSPWFALRVWTGREKAVESTLAEMGVTSLVPMRKGPDRRRRHRLIEGALMPVIHGYVLVQMHAHPVYLASFTGVEHVLSVLGGCDKPMRLKPSEVSKFKAMADAGDYDWERDVDLVLLAGEKVLVTGGPFAGLNAHVVTPSRKGRGDVVVSMRIMSGNVPVTMPLALLEKV